MKKPATPLPYRREKSVLPYAEFVFAIRAKEGSDTTVVADLAFDPSNPDYSVDNAQQDADYIVEAANTYPRAMKLLQGFYTKVLAENKKLKNTVISGQLDAINKFLKEFK